MSVGEIQEDAIRNIYGVIGSLYGGMSTTSSGSLRSGAFALANQTYINWSGLGLTSGGDSVWNVAFEAKKVVSTDIENRPRSIALLGCVKTIKKM